MYQNSSPEHPLLAPHESKQMAQKRVHPPSVLLAHFARARAVVAVAQQQNRPGIHSASSFQHSNGLRSTFEIAKLFSSL